MADRHPYIAGLAAKVDDCINVIDITKERGGPGYNDWEKGFLTSVHDWLKTHEWISVKQRNQINRLWDLI